MNRHFKYSLFVILSLFIFCATASAQPDAGTLLQEQRQLTPSLPDRLPAEEKKEIVKPPLADTGIKVLVKGFHFTGRYETMTTEAELQKLVSGYVGKELGFSELQQIAAQVTNYLREKKGFLLARAYLPKQDITAGIIEIVVMDGRIDGNVRINLKAPSRIRPKLLQGMADRAVPGDSPVRMEQIERTVLLMNDLPGINAQASLEPGSAPGTTRLAINAAEGRLFHGILSADDYGDRYTGAWRGMGQVALYDPLGLGDQLSASVTGAERMLSGRAAYAIPLGSSGLTAGAYYNYLQYTLGEELKNLNAKGWAHTLGANLTYPILRTRGASVWAGLGFEYLMLDDEANNAQTRDRKLPVGNLNLTGSFYDGFGGGGLTNANLAFYGGSVDLSGLQANKIADEAGPQTGGGFSRGAYSLARLQRITRSLSLYGSIRGQLASGNLDSSQKFILGGPTGIRAYPVGEAPGDEGHAGTLEARLDIPFMPVWATTQVVGFFDAGWVKLHRTLYTGALTNATGRNDYTLSGGGIGINVGKPGLYSLRASYAHKIGLNEGRSPTGKDCDNRSDQGRLWLQLVVWI